MMTDSIREALSATQEAWTEAYDSLPRDDPERRAAVLSALDNATSELADALRAAGAEPDDE
jgi:myo-inositol catabolism protein IolC